ncbi:phage tail sheath family protein [Erwinia oleae]|uniref:phage tail sheath family protein n=1 Tax=Erwinia oleae TaxID=796334 RepID=UPI00054DD180|nr:phage tail sheath C-terminal domain-containing protein [Erwinia oleae]
MTIETAWPDIYLTEDSALNISVDQSPTAVTAFTFRRTSGEAVPLNASCRVNSLREFTQAMDPNAKGNYFNSLKYAFMQGGGPCYLIHKDEVAEEIGKYDDITLVVTAGIESDIFPWVEEMSQRSTPVFTLLNAPKNKISTNPAEVMKDYPAVTQAAAFHPWINVNGIDGLIPPSVAAAVAIAQTDRIRGVRKAPANVILNGAIPAFGITDDLQEQFNSGKALNIIREFSDEGTRVWGARTLDDYGDWRYIAVRRLFNSIARDVKRALRSLLFMPNSSLVWIRVKAAVDNYLDALWRCGALAGSTPKTSYFVEIGKDLTMTTEDINQVRMSVNVGIAPVRPAEFIVLSLTHQINNQMA